MVGSASLRWRREKRFFIDEEREDVLLPLLEGECVRPGVQGSSMGLGMPLARGVLWAEYMPCVPMLNLAL